MRLVRKFMEGGVSGLGMRPSSKNWRMFLINGLGASIFGAGAILAVLMTSSFPVFSQTPPNAQATNTPDSDDHSYLPPSMQIKSSSEAALAKPVSSKRRSAQRRTRRRSRDFASASGQSWGFFDD